MSQITGSSTPSSAAVLAALVGQSITALNYTGTDGTIMQEFDAVNQDQSILSDGLLLFNGSPATVGNQQYSPIFHQYGSGWKTNATAGARAVGFAWQVIPVQGAAAPTGIYNLMSEINGTYTVIANWGSAGDLTLLSGTVVVSTPVLNASQTWNAGGVTFTAVKVNVTSTASASGSLLMDLQIGGVSKFNVDKSGNVTHVGTLQPNAIYLAGSGNAIICDNSSEIRFGTGAGSKIGTDVAQKLAFHNSTPVAQRAGSAQAAVAATAATNSSPYGFTQTQADAIVALVNELRAALVEKGLIKGSA